jgi:ferredoxin-NADP reductase
VTFGVKFSQISSTFKSALAALPDGTQIRATSVGGDFLLPTDQTIPVLLVAGGIGITPFISQLEEARRRDTVVVYTVSSPAEIAFADELAAAGVPVLLVAPEAPATLPPTWRYLGPDRVSADLLQREVPGFAGRHAYVSGPPALVNDLKSTLKAAGLKRIVTDYFTGY